jgi:hypothetical protein
MGVYTLTFPIKSRCGGEVSWSVVNRDSPWAMME